MQELQNDIVEWADKKFGQKNPIESVLTHLIEEAKDLLKEPYNAIAYADVLILLLTAAHKAEYNVEELETAIKTKMTLNKARVWQEPDAQGITRHYGN